MTAQVPCPICGGTFTLSGEDDRLPAHGDQRHERYGLSGQAPECRASGFPGPAAELRRHLEGLRRERARQQAAEESLKRRIGMAIAAGRGMPGLTVEGAAELVGISKPTAYDYMALAGAGRADDVGEGDGLGGTP